MAIRLKRMGSPRAASIDCINWRRVARYLVSVLLYIGQACFVFAQSSISEPDSSAIGASLEEVVVTARKLSENAQRVPVSITALTGNELLDLQVANIGELSSVIPGITLRQASLAPSALQIQLRGQLQNDTLATEDPSVGVYVDGVYWARAYGMNADLLDVQDLQVLNGPQGTLFGRNTTGGALVLQTRDPELASFSGIATATAGRFNERDGTIVLNAPIIADTLGVRAAFQTNNRDGYIFNTTTGGNLANEQTWTGRFKVLYKIGPRTTILFSAELYNANENANPFRMAYVAPPEVASLTTPDPIIGSVTNAEAAVENRLFVGGAPNVVAGSQLLQQYIATSQGNTVAMNQDWPTLTNTRTAMNTTTYNLDWGTLKFIGAYRSVLDNAGVDLAGSAYLGAAPAYHDDLSLKFHRDLSQWSGELQLAGKPMAEKLDFAAGIFYFAEHGLDQSESVTLPAFNPTTTVYDGYVKNSSDGVYAQSSYRVTEAAGLTAGLRYSSDDKGLVSRNRTLAPAGAFGPNLSQDTQECNVVPPGPAAFGVAGDPCSSSQSKTFSALSYTFGIDYRFAPNLMAYVKTDKASRSGGQNLRGGFYTINGHLTSTLFPFNPEFVKDVELGFKSQLWENRARINVALYHSWNTDIQKTLVVVTDQTPDTIVVNAGKQVVSGLETEFRARALAFARDELLLAINGAYTDPKYTQYVDPITGANLAGSRFEGVPKWTANLNAEYTHTFGAGRLRLSGDYAWRSTMALQPYNDTTDPFNPGLVTASTSGSVGLLNARATFSTMDDALELGLWGKNVTNKHFASSAVEFGAPLDTVYTLYGAPRMLGAMLTYRFGESTRRQ
jgi:iron complex outermembrane receptor protein